jgi:hypothetical protein
MLNGPLRAQRQSRRQNHDASMMPGDFGRTRKRLSVLDVSRIEKGGPKEPPGAT